MEIKFTVVKIRMHDDSSHKSLHTALPFISHLYKLKVSASVLVSAMMALYLFGIINTNFSVSHTASSPLKRKKEVISQDFNLHLKTPNFSH